MLNEAVAVLTGGTGKLSSTVECDSSSGAMKSMLSIRSVRTSSDLPLSRILSVGLTAGLAPGMGPLRGLRPRSSKHVSRLICDGPLTSCPGLCCG